VILPENYPERTGGLVLVFDVRNSEQADALHRWRAVFGAATEIEALDQDTYTLTIFPGLCWHGEEAA
jgi:hypothetical protein